MTEKIIVVKNLCRHYGQNKAVDNISFSVQEGSVHGFLGPNGAGKTTVIKMLLGLIMPNSGEISIFGQDLFSNRKQIMKKIGAVVEAPALFEYMTAYDNLFYLSKFSGGASKEKILDAISTVGLYNVKDKKVGTFSYGMKQRLGIAQTLLPENKLIFLDEPTNGLDPHGIASVRDLIGDLSQKKGVTIFLSSHLLSEVEQVCDSVSVINVGKIICESNVSTLLQAEERIEIVTDRLEIKKFCETESIRILTLKEKNGKIHILTEGREEDIPPLAKKICDGGFKLYKIGKIKNKLEDIFVELTGKDQRNLRSDRF